MCSTISYILLQLPLRMSLWCRLLPFAFFRRLYLQLRQSCRRWDRHVQVEKHLSSLSSRQDARPCMPIMCSLQCPKSAFKPLYNLYYLEKHPTREQINRCTKVIKIHAMGERSGSGQHRWVKRATDGVLVFERTGATSSDQRYTEGR